MIDSSKLTGKRIAEYIEQGNRFDGRKLDEFRDVSVELGVSIKAEGSAKVKIGNTEVWVGVKLGLTTPYSDAPDKGNLMVTAELLPLSHTKYEYGPPKFPAIELGRLVDRGIRESKFIDFKKLCIKEGEKVWNIFLDVFAINDDGNVLDAAFIGAVAALKSAKMPFYDEKTEAIDYEKESKQMVPLTDNVPMNLCIHKIGSKVFLDPSIEEEQASEGRVVLAFLPGKPPRICSMQKSNTMETTSKEFDEILKLADEKYKTFFPEIEKKIEAAIKAYK